MELSQIRRYRLVEGHWAGSSDQTGKLKFANNQDEIDYTRLTKSRKPIRSC
jgi:hypothetical protein